MADVRARFGRSLRGLREARGLTQEALAAASGLDRSYVGGVERGERNPSLMAIARLANALQTPVSSLFIAIDTEKSVAVVERGRHLTIRFRYDQYDAEYVLHGARQAEYEEVLLRLRDGLASAKSNADAVADAFIQATVAWPDANPSDLWTFLVSRIYCDPSNHPPANARLNLEQSWKRTSGLALERVLVRHYAPALERRGIAVKIGDRAEKLSLLGVIDDPRIVPDKADILMTYDAPGGEKLLGVVHVKASIAERRTDDVPMSQALIEAGYLSVFWTMDSKSFPSASPANRGEFGGVAGDRVSDKRRDFEEHGHFSACFSYNSNTLPTTSEDAVAKILVCDFRNPDDRFVRFLVEARQRLHR